MTEHFVRLLDDNRAAPMARVCSWCQSVMSFGTHPATHGICPACIARLTDQRPLPILDGEIIDDDEPADCPECRGAGEVALGQTDDATTCTACNGTGRVGGR